MIPVEQALKPIAKAPFLVPAVVFGWNLVGRLEDATLAPFCLRMHWLTFLFLPVLPTAVYLVDDSRAPDYAFAGKLSLSDFHRLYRGRLGAFYRSVFDETVEKLRRNGLYLLGGLVLFAAILYLSTPR